MRLLLTILMIAGVVWLLVPETRLSVTEMGFDPGEPDPNLRTTEYSLGSPMPWISLVHSSRESTETDHWYLRSGNYRSILIHAGVIMVPAWLLLRLRRRPCDGRSD